MNKDIVNVNPTISVLFDSIDDQFELTTTYIDEKITEQHEYTDQEVEALRTEGYILEALTQALAWVTSDEGKLFRKKSGQEKVQNGHHLLVLDYTLNFKMMHIMQRQKN
jgi:hypothetical protein